jgi:hypothetical protein
VDRVDERVIADAGGMDGVGVRARQLVRAERQLLEETERRAQALVDRRRTPVALDRLPDLIPECVRRDRAVRVRSERTLVQRRDERCEQLALAVAPVGLAAHRQVERV